jgi:hypothetical protein
LEPSDDDQTRHQAHDRRTDAESDPILPENQQTLSGALENIVNISRPCVEPEAAPAISKPTPSKTDLQ